MPSHFQLRIPHHQQRLPACTLLALIIAVSRGSQCRTGINCYRLVLLAGRNRSVGTVRSEHGACGFPSSRFRGAFLVSIPSDMSCPTVLRLPCRMMAFARRLSGVARSLTLFTEARGGRLRHHCRFSCHPRLASHSFPVISRTGGKLSRERYPEYGSAPRSLVKFSLDLPRALQHNRQSVFAGRANCKHYSVHSKS